MREILILLIFCMVLFLYLHVHFHIKTSNDLEVYKIDSPSKEKLEEICDMRQPVVFDYLNERLLEMCNRQTLLDTYGAFDVKIRNVKTPADDDEEIYVNLPLSSALSAINEDTESKYLSENNRDFLDETGIVKVYKYNDEFIRPFMVARCYYDFIIGSKQLQTPFRYNVNYRNYFLVTEGSVNVKMTPPRSGKYLYPHNDYENFEFRSPVNPWNVQHQYKADFDKIKCLEVSLKAGQMLSIPAYWWYSFEYEVDSSIASFQYRTYMNTIAVLPKICMSFLQTQNITHKLAHQLNNEDVASSDIEELPKEN